MSTNILYYTNFRKIITTKYQVSAQAPMEGVGNGKESLTFFYGSKDNSPNLLVTNTAAISSTVYTVSGYSYEKQNPPYVYPFYANNGNYYFVIIDFPLMRKHTPISLYSVSLSNGVGNAKFLYSMPYYQYAGGIDFFLDSERKNIIFIGSPNGVHQENTIEFLTYNFDSNTVTNSTMDNNSGFDFIPYSSYFTRSSSSSSS